MTSQLPTSSRPPSTPKKISSNGFFGANPSTTPAGPPPSSTGSSTPAGHPSSLFFGSSMMGGTPLNALSFSQQTNLKSASSPPANYRRSAAPPARSGLSNEYQASPQRGFRPPSSHGEEDDFLEEYSDSQLDNSRVSIEKDIDGIPDENIPYEEDADMDGYGSDFQTSREGYGDSQRSDNLLRSTLPGLKRGRGDNLLGFGDSTTQSMTQTEPSDWKRLAKDLYTQMPPPLPTEPEDLILNTEAIVEKLYQKSIAATGDDAHTEELLTSTTKELVDVWALYRSKVNMFAQEDYDASVGLPSDATGFERAEYLASLTLQMQHPEKISKSFDRKVKPLSQLLLEWMAARHNFNPYEFQELTHWKPSPAAHRLFWSVMVGQLLRGQILAVIDVLRRAGWENVVSDSDSMQSQLGSKEFSGPVLDSVNRVIAEAVETMGSCPAVRGDWNTKSNDWTFFRSSASRALGRLKDFAEGNKRDRIEVAGSRPSPPIGSYASRAQKAESKLPWSVYQGLVTMYNLMIGDKHTIISASGDWFEATVGLLVWWEEGRDDRRLAPLGRSQSTYRAASRESDDVAYRRKLRTSFQIATGKDTSVFSVNSATGVEVCLASLFEGDLEAVVGFLRGWSGPVSSAVAEVASLGGWLPRTEEKNLINMGGLDEDDMDVLGYTSPSRVDGVKDKTLIAYARSLANRGALRGTVAGRAQNREGWELTISILGRLDCAERAEEMISEFLNRFLLDSSKTVDKLWKLLNDIDMPRHAEQVADSYAKGLAKETHKYGEAIWYYALAHRDQEVKNVLDLLISYSLIQSFAFPPESEMDTYLSGLVSSPKRSLTDMSALDVEAAELLHKALSGYATLRKFYALRDADLAPSSNKSKLGLTARKMEAASSLLAVITSSNDNIRGGLYDEERGAVVSVDYLLALLGEALVLVNQSDYTITVSQIDILLRAIEDLEAVGPRVYSACASFLQTVVASGQGLQGSSPADLLRKSTSDGSGTSGSFLMVDSTMFASQMKQSMKSMGSSGVLVTGEIKRGWDWRNSISAATSGEDVLRTLRLGLAKDLAKAYLLESDSRM
ncbi:aconitate hydratase [Diplocarpon rosae]|nr:aconitate hydratase [Diplocarpon rosae]